MIVNASTIFLIVILLTFFYMLMTSRRDNICILIALSGGIILTILMYLMFFVVFDLSDIALAFGKQFQEFPSFPKEDNKIISFAIGYLMSIYFVISFIIIDVICHSLIIRDNYFMKKNKRYYFMKTILIFTNTIMAIAVTLFIISDFNIAYNMPGSFLYFLFDMVKEGIFLL